MTTAELIEKLERAEGPSRELFEEVFVVIRGRPFVWRHEDGDHESTDPILWRFLRMLNAEAWESAALMLVPEGWTYEGRQGPSGFPHLWTLSTIKCGDVRYTTVMGRARFAAIALCIAALKAKEADNG